MYDNRRSRRIPVKLNLNVSSLFKQDNIQVENIDAEIEVIDISRTGIGFISESHLPIGYYFNAELELGEGEQSILFCVVKIIRSRELEDGKVNYGCEFVGMASIFSDVFDKLEKKANGIY